MKIGFVVNDVATEQAGYTTTRLAMAAHNRGHEAWAFGVGDFDFDHDERIRARARRAPAQNFKSLSTYLAALQGPKANVQRIEADDLDVLMLRNDPAGDTGHRGWAQSAGIIFGRAAGRRGVIVLNDPDGLSRAQTKMFLQDFPEEIRPKTLITRDRAEIRAFAREMGGQIVLKPLQGSGGANVFLVRPGDMSNLNQMVDAVSRDGYVIAQEYLTAAEEGDIRLFVMNGLPLRAKGKYAAFRRLRASDDIRSNVHVGGQVVRAEIGETELRLAEICRPKLVMEGMFLVGLDIVGNRLMEINVFSPGGLGSARTVTGVSFTKPVIDSLERKVQYASFYQRNFGNVEMATL
ncbi:MAG: glutathione synthetase [Planctomycetota bacterium]|jgi:glutathione synthase